MSSDHVWPTGGELDIAEFANDQPNLVAWWCTPAIYFWTIFFCWIFWHWKIIVLKYLI